MYESVFHNMERIESMDEFFCVLDIPPLPYGGYAGMSYSLKQEGVEVTEWGEQVLSYTSKYWEPGVTVLVVVNTEGMDLTIGKKCPDLETQVARWANENGLSSCPFGTAPTLCFELHEGKVVYVGRLIVSSPPAPCYFLDCGGPGYPAVHYIDFYKGKIGLGGGVPVSKGFDILFALK